MKIDFDQTEVVKTDKELAAEAASAEAVAYLNSTAWYAIRNLETGEPVPDDVQAQRTAAYETLKEAP